MRTSITALLLLVAGLTGGSTAYAQTPPPQPPPPPPGAAAPAPPPPAAAPAPPPPAPTVVVVQPAPPPPVVVGVAVPGPTGATGATGAPGAPAPPVPMWYDKFAVDAFVDAYASLNYNGPKPQGPLTIGTGTAGGNGLRAFDVANGFSLNWAGINASYTADPIGGTVGLRFGPGATLYNASPVTGAPSDNQFGLTFVKQAYATWKPADKLTLDFGKWDQPYGSEVADSQLNMNYTRSVLFWFMQPLFFTGLRVDYAPIDMLDLKVFAANGWNNTIDSNAGKTFGAQVMLKPADQAIFYLGWVGGPEQVDFGVGGMPPAVVSNDANSNWRHMIDFVADINPTKELRFLLNFDYRTETKLPDGGMAATTHSASVYGGNLVVRYSFSDAFYASLRGEFYHDEHGDTIPTKNVEDGTLTLAYGIGNHLAFMLDNRLDVGDDPIFQTLSSTSKTQFTSTLGIIASTK